MKRKITKIGTLLASVALLFGATSWANAQSVTITFSPNADCTGFESKIEGDGASAVEASFTKGEKLGELKKVTDTKSQTDFVGMTVVEALSNPTNCADFKITVKDENYAFTITKVSYEAVKSGTDATGKGHGIYQQIAADSKKFWEGHVKANDIHRNNYPSESHPDDDGAKLGHEIEKSVTCANTCDVYLGPGDHIGAGKVIGIREIKIEGTVVKRVKVAYIAANPNVEGKHIHPVYDALASDAAFITELVVKDGDVALDPADFKDKYDVVLLGGDASGKGAQAVSFPQLAAQVPLLNVTKAFAYGKGSGSDVRSGWGSGENGMKGAALDNYVVREKKYRTHPVFDGLNKDTIVVFADYATHVSASWTSVMQGYPKLSDQAPAHTLLGNSGTSNKTSVTPLVNSVAEAWVKNEAGTDSIPYMIVAYDNDMMKNSDSLTQLTADGARLYKNAVLYLDSARVQYIPPIIGECPQPNVAFAQVKSKENGGTTESDTLRWVLNITVDKVFKDMKKVEAEKVDPKVTVTIGDGAAHLYDAAKPDTLWEPCDVKVLVESDYYIETEKTQAFTNEGLRKLPDLKPVYTVIDKDNDPRHVLTFEIAKVSLDGKDTIPTIKYSLDGSDNLALTYDANKPDTLGLDATVKAQAQLYLYLPSNLVSENWHNPYAKQVDKPEITFVPDPAYPDGCVQLVTITTATEGATIYYTLDGQEANEHSWLYQGPFPITNFDAVALQAIAMRDGWAASDRAYDTIPASTSEPLAVPTITLSADGNSFEIASTDNRGAIYYTMDGTEPSETNGLKYTGKVTYCGTDTTYLLVAKGQGYGYRASAVSDTTKFTPKAEVPVMGKPLYVSTFGKDDPNNVPGSGDVLEKGWFRYNTKNGDTYNMPAAFLTEEEEAEGISWDQDKQDQTKDPRIHIFINTKSNEGHDWRHYNDWVFYRDPAAPRDGQKGFRIMLHSGYNPGDTTYETTKGAFHFFHKSETTPARLSAGPVAKYKGPFAVRVVVAGGEKLDGNSTSAAIKVCVSDSSEVLNEIVLGRISNKPHESACDTFYYYGDNEVNIRLVSDEQIDGGAVFDFAVLGAGAALPPLAIESIDPATGTTEETAAEIAETVNVFKVTFNNDITINDPSGTVVIGWTEPGVEGTAWCDAVVEEGNVLVITLPEDAPKVGGAVYELSIDADNVIDGDKQRNEGVKYYYKVKAAESSIDEVSAAKEVVATHIYSISGAEIPALKQGVNIVKTIYSDGTMTFEKVQVK